MPPTSTQRVRSLQMDHCMELCYGKIKYTDQWAIRYVWLFAFGGGEFLMAMYKCASCGKEASSPGMCCGAQMKPK
jgi:hypothetical protein